MEIQGIDVAKWQGSIDWAKVSKSKSFAILKVTNKNNNIEDSFIANYNGAVKNGLSVGVYRYVYATTEAAAKAEANAIVKALKTVNAKLDMKVWLDLEDSSIKKCNLNAVIEAESSILRSAGYEVGIYCNKDWYNNVLNGKELSKRYEFWIARYPSSDKGIYNSASTLSPKSYAQAWQYSSKGKVEGISGNVDLDVYFDYAAPVKANAEYYPAYKGNSLLIDTVLNDIGAPYGSVSKRKALAVKNGFKNYSGKGSENISLVNLAKAGKLKRV